jgi:hypothetical protein
MNKIASVTLYANGMVMVFGIDGEQIPEYQGRYDEVKEKIRAAYDGPWIFGVWQTWQCSGLSFEAIEFTVRQLKACWHEEST